MGADEFEVHAVRYAERTGVRGQHFHGYDESWGEPHPTAYFVWLARSANHTVVIDAGMRADRAARIPGLEYFGSPPEMLAQLGVPAESVDHLVLTHLHYDHTGTARDFPNARYLVQQSEVDYWTGPSAKRITREHWLFDETDLDQLGDRLDLVNGDEEVLPGLSVHLVGGHTAGMQIVRVATARGNVVLASDASHFYENVEDDRPGGILHSMPGIYRAFDRITELADGPHLVVAGHDPEVLDRYPAEGSSPHVVRIA